MYLMDGEQQIMISEALNESDRLSSCSKRHAKAIAAWKARLTCMLFRRSTITMPPKVLTISI